MITIEVNGKKVEARGGEMLLTVLRRAGVNVPTLCHMENLLPTGACRLCVVEETGQHRLITSCATPVADGMSIRTHSPRVLRARKTIVELLLANHPDDCLYCVRSGTCKLQGLAGELGVRDRRYVGGRSEHKIDTSSPSVTRDPAKCILCGRCVRVCEEVQGVSAIDFVARGSKAHVGTAFEQGLNVSSCVNCGQCIMVCPTGALREESHTKRVMDALQDPDLFVVAQHAPAVSVTLAEELASITGGVNGPRPGTDVNGQMVAVLRQMGFDRVFDTSFSADLTVMEEGSELVQRIQTGGALPMMTSCSPGWIKYVEEFYPEFIGNLSTCKSPQQMMGAILKHYYAQKQGIDPKKVFVVSIMPCTAKKFEAQRSEMLTDGVPDVDAVLTTRGLARMIVMQGLDLGAMTPESADTPFGERSTAGKMFGVTGGVMEAAVRSAHYLLTGKELGKVDLKELRGLAGVKQARVKLGTLELGVAVVSGLGNARQLLEEIKAGRNDLHFIEVMTCPGGCIAGGGQPVTADVEAIRGRMQAIYKIDRDETLRCSHHNASVKQLYEEFLEKPLSHRSHELLHTSYGRRDVVR